MLLLRIRDLRDTIKLKFDLDSGVAFMTAVSLLVTNMIIGTGQERVVSYIPKGVLVGSNT